MSNSRSPLPNTLEHVPPLFFHLILVRWKNNGVTFSNVFCNGEFEFAIIFYVSLAWNRKKPSRSHRHQSIFGNPPPPLILSRRTPLVTVFYFFFMVIFQQISSSIIIFLFSFPDFQTSHQFSRLRLIFYNTFPIKIFSVTNFFTDFLTSNFSWITIFFIHRNNFSHWSSKFWLRIFLLSIPIFSPILMYSFSYQLPQLVCFFYQYQMNFYH